jgi:DNA invertase Pin-like site-specific DNA recombinase
LTDFKTRAARQLGDSSFALGALWEAFKAEATLERYAALREAARAAGEWDTGSFRYCNPHKEYDRGRWKKDCDC